MQIFDARRLTDEGSGSGKPYLEFLRVPDLSAGIYKLRAGEPDRQSPHTEDEVYYVMTGKAKIRVENEDHEVHAGSIIYVPKGAEHRFHEIVEDLALLVFFAPAEHIAER